MTRGWPRSRCGPTRRTRRVESIAVRDSCRLQEKCRRRRRPRQISTCVAPVGPRGRPIRASNKPSMHRILEGPEAALSSGSSAADRYAMLSGDLSPGVGTTNGCSPTAEEWHQAPPPRPGGDGGAPRRRKVAWAASTQAPRRVARLVGHEAAARSATRALIKTSGRRHQNAALEEFRSLRDLLRAELETVRASSRLFSLVGGSRAAHRLITPRSHRPRQLLGGFRTCAASRTNGCRGFSAMGAAFFFRAKRKCHAPVRFSVTPWSEYRGNGRASSLADVARALSAGRTDDEPGLLPLYDV